MNLEDFDGLGEEFVLDSEDYHMTSIVVGVDKFKCHF